MRNGVTLCLHWRESLLCLHILYCDTLHQEEVKVTLMEYSRRVSSRNWNTLMHLPSLSSKGSVTLLTLSSLYLRVHKIAFINKYYKLYCNITIFITSFISSAWSSGSHSIQLLSYPPTTMFSKYSPQTSQNQSLEEASNGLCVGANP